MQMTTLLWRALLFAVVTAIASVLAEFAFDLVMHQLAKPIVFTSFFSVSLYSVLMSFVPFWPSPSRLSSAAIKLGGRLLLLSEVTLFVASAILASSWYMDYRHVLFPINVSFVASAYVFLLLLTLAANLSKLRTEWISAA